MLGRLTFSLLYPFSLDLSFLNHCISSPPVYGRRVSASAEAGEVSFPLPCLPLCSRPSPSSSPPIYLRF